LPDFGIEKHIIQKGYKVVAGIDEAGRGALFGPVVAAAVVFPVSLVTRKSQEWLEEIDDSKLLSATKRKILAKLILIHARSVGVGIATNKEIDRQNIYRASLEAMRRAVGNMPIEPEYLLIDGFNLEPAPCPQKRIPQGDRKSTSIAAASILAKVVRDEIIIHLDKVYFGYALKKNKGYGTREHYSALEELGPTDFHRYSFNLGNHKKQ
jgi:ribonuclease HII